MKAKTANTSKAQQAISETALKNFPKSKLRSAMDLIAERAKDSEAASNKKQAAAMEVCMLAHGFRLANTAADTGTVMDGWRRNMAVLALELATAGNRFASITKGKDGKPDTAKFTGYGNNVVSIAKGVIQFELDPAKCTGEDGSASYREVRKTVEAKRAEIRRADKPDEAALQDALGRADEAYKTLRTLVAGFKDVSIVDNLTAVLTDAHAKVEAQRQQQAATEAAAKGKEMPEAEQEPEKKAA